MSKNLFLVAGKPGSGKSTASRLAATLLTNVYHFSIGDEIRARAFDGKQSAVSDELQNYIEVLKLHKPVPPHLSARVFEECIATSVEDTIIVDGYPQYVDRLLGFRETLQRVDAKVVAVCEIDISDDIARQRIISRGQRTADIAEDEAFINKRIAGYYINVVPILATLQEQFPLHIINGDQLQEAVAKDLAQVINKYLN